MLGEYVEIGEFKCPKCRAVIERDVDPEFEPVVRVLQWTQKHYWKDVDDA